MTTYVDTSALAKWYVREPNSDEFEVWIRSVECPTISSLSLVEMRCLLARRRRTGSLDNESESQAYALFLQDIDQRHLTVEPLDDADVRSAVHHGTAVAEAEEQGGKDADVLEEPGNRWPAGGAAANYVRQRTQRDSDVFNSADNGHGRHQDQRLCILDGLEDSFVELFVTFQTSSYSL